MCSWLHCIHGSCSCHVASWSMMVWVVFWLRCEFRRWIFDAVCSSCDKSPAACGSLLSWTWPLIHHPCHHAIYEVRRLQPALQQHRKGVQVTATCYYAWERHSHSQTKNSAALKDAAPSLITRLCPIAARKFNLAQVDFFNVVMSCKILSYY